MNGWMDHGWADPEQELRTTHLPLENHKCKGNEYTQLDGRTDGWMDGWMGGSKVSRQRVRAPPKKSQD